MARDMWGQTFGMRGSVAAACALLASACMAEALPPVVGDGDDGSGELRPDEREASSLAESLGEGQPLAVTGSAQEGLGSLIRVEAGRSGEVGVEALRELELAVLGGYIDVRAIDDEVGAIRDLVIDIDDIALPQGLVTADVTFTGVQARIARPETFKIAWGEHGERAEAIVALDLVVDWGVSINGGEMHPLAPVKIDSLEVVLELTRGERGRVEAQLAGFRDGVFYEWGGMVELRGLAMDVRAGTGAP
jgi:hypothetical protein